MIIATLSDAAVTAPAIPVPSAVAPKTRSRAAVTLARLLRHLSDALVPACNGGPAACCDETLRPAPNVPGFIYCSQCGGMTLPAVIR